MPEAQRQALDRYIAGCLEVAPQFRWTPAANLHLTIRFVGGVEREVVDGVVRALDALRPPAFDLALGDVGAFKRGSAVRVVWLGLKTGGREAEALAAQVEAECVGAGLAPEARPFQPHMTLARARNRDGSPLPPLPAVPSLEPWTVGELILYSSHLGKPAAVYEPLQKVRLE